MIIYRGTLTKAKLQELAAKHLAYRGENPQDFIKENVISIIKQDDGNWIGWMRKFGKVVSARQSDPTTVLQMLITHSGEVSNG